MPIVCDCLGNLKWTTGYYSGGNIFSDSYAVPNFEYEIYDDIFQGSYKDVNIDIIKAKFKEIYYKRGRKRKRTVFKGVIVKLDMNKSFTGHTVIQPSSLIKLAPSKKMDDSRQYFKMYEEILTVIKLIDHLKMYQKIGL